MMIPMDTTTPTLPAGIDVRPARPGDLPGLQAMVERCSPDTLHRRFHGVVGSGARRELERIAHPTGRHRSWVAVDGDGDVHGTSTLAWGHDGEVEVAFLVEDDHQRRGLGRALAGVAAEEARAAGVPQVEAIVQPDNRRALRFLRAVAPGLSMRFADGSTVATIALAPPAAAIPPISTPGTREAA